MVWNSSKGVDIAGTYRLKSCIAHQESVLHRWNVSLFFGFSFVCFWSALDLLPRNVVQPGGCK